MSLNFIDIASYQAGLDLSKIKTDGVIVKATEGTGYVNPYCDGHFQQALKLGKVLGVYHFARNATGNTAKAEAEYFIKNTKGYVGKAIPVLDWEDADTSNVDWALEWLQIVEKAYGCKPLIYMSESVVNAHDWKKVADAGYGLWVAKYRDNEVDKNWDMSNAGTVPSVKYWGFYAAWQWTSSLMLDGWGKRLDGNIFYGDKTAWEKYVGKSASKPSEPEKPSKPSTPSTKYKVGDTVNINGIYVSKDSKEKLKPAVSSGKITKIYAGANNPYLIGDGTGFVNDACITGKKGSTSSKTLKVGMKAKPKKAISYDGVKLDSFVTKKYFKVIEVKGKRVVLGDGLNTAFNIDNLTY